jgi:hypothetical protein
MSEHTTHATPTEAPACALCGSRLIDLADAVEVAPRIWDVTLRCADCAGEYAVSCTEDALARLEHALCRAAADLERELERFARLRFEEDVERFAAALRAGAILPMDFGTPR